MRVSVRAVANYVVFAFLFFFVSIFISRSAVVAPIPSISDEVEEKMPSPPPVFVIDPGHGGEDGGAEVNGVLEKNINLDVSLRISDICTIFGKNALLTRTDDRLLYDAFDELEDYTGKKKTYDLRNRLRLAEESGAELFIGIHMNKFPETQYKGLQVYYSPNTDSGRTAAEFIKTYSKNYLDPTNNREIKAAGKSIYILNRIEMPAVLVECGFLSNDTERALLLSPEYQQKLASVIFASCAEFITAN